MTRSSSPDRSEERFNTDDVHHAREVDVRSGSRLCENLTDAMIPVLNREGMMAGFVQAADRQQTTMLRTSCAIPDNIGFCSYSRPSYPVRRYRLAETRHTSVSRKRAKHP